MFQDQIITVQEREHRRVLPAYSLHLDLVRGLAALLVFVGHLRLIITGHTGAASASNGVGAILHHPANATGLGHASVVIFFVLSGYLVGGSVLRDLGRNAFSWSKYAVRRLSRLWTVLIPCLLIGGSIDYLTSRWFANTQVFVSGEFTQELHGFPGVLDFVKYLSFLQSIDRLTTKPFGTNVALWSLSAEFWYYVLFPLLAAGILSRSRTKLFRVSLAVLTACLMWFLGKSLMQYFPLWLCGVAAYLAPMKIPARIQKALIAGLVLQFCMVLYFCRAHEVDPLAADVFIALSFTCLLYALLHRLESAGSSVYARIAHGLSFPSYTLYASHIPICIFLAAFFEARTPELFRHTYTVTALVFVLVLIYAGIMYMCFERNTDHVRRFLEDHFLTGHSAKRAAVAGLRA
ncbi:MAG: acyltransferase [Acidobacteriota bacterium]|nr:acyltransferase [Acidobacteriota bacterium]